MIFGSYKIGGGGGEKKENLFITYEAKMVLRIYVGVNLD